MESVNGMVRKAGWRRQPLFAKTRFAMECLDMSTRRRRIVETGIHMIAFIAVSAIALRAKLKNQSGCVQNGKLKA